MPKLNSDLLDMRKNNIGRLFQRAARTYSERAVFLLQEKGYTDITLFHTALIANLDVDGTRISVLADRAGVTKQAMGQIAHELEEKGYIKKINDPKDKRASLICFTTLGEAALQAAYEVKQDIEKEYMKILGTEDLKQLRAVLERLVNNQ